MDVPITVDVNYDNLAPEISHFLISSAGANTWIISGDISDADDDISNFIVQFHGVFEDRSAVDANGHFAFAVILDGNTWGTEYAIVDDGHGGVSNEPFCDIGLT